VAGRLEPWEHGVLVRAPELPSYYDVNLVRVDGRDPGLSAEALAALADEWLSELEHRRVEVEDEAAGARLRSAFEAMGWVAERLAWLRRTGPAPRVPGPAGATLRAVPFAATRSLRLAWQKESIYPDGPDVLPVEEAVAARRGARAVLAEAPQPAGFATWSSDGETAEVELVFCLPEHRGRGLGGALVARALAEAGAGEALIVADDAGAAKRLYERLGFRTIWRQYVFTRMPSRPVR